MPALTFLLAMTLSRVLTAAGGCGGLTEAVVMVLDGLTSLLLLRQRPIILLEDCFCGVRSAGAGDSETTRKLDGLDSFFALAGAIEGAEEAIVAGELLLPIPLRLCCFEGVSTSAVKQSCERELPSNTNGSFSLLPPIAALLIDTVDVVLSLPLALLSAVEVRIAAKGFSEAILNAFAPTRL
jgi:hypothetical protein